jgi:pimeloyl-ACP methyl ester carboxylesterase
MALVYIRAKFKLLSLLSKRKAAEQAFILFCTPQHRNTKDLPAVFTEAENLQFDFKGDSIHGYRWNGSSDKKILILHGFESGIVNFDRYVKPLVEKGFCVLGFDAPAHGRSSGDMINVLLYKEFIEFVQRRFGPVRAFIGHSLGGLALSLALEEMPGNADCRAVLIAPATETTTAVDYLFSILRLGNGLRPEFEKLIQEKGGRPTGWFSVSRAAQQIRAQVLWVHDRDDDLTPLSDIEPVMAKGYPNFRFRITEGLGHRRIYRDNTVAGEIVRFLANEA